MIAETNNSYVFKVTEVWREMIRVNTKCYAETKNRLWGSQLSS